MLAYDPIPIQADIANVRTVAPEMRLGLIVRTTVTVYSGRPAVSYPFIHPGTRLSAPPRGAAMISISVGQPERAAPLIIDFDDDDLGPDDLPAQTMTGISVASGAQVPGNERAPGRWPDGARAPADAAGAVAGHPGARTTALGSHRLLQPSPRGILRP